MLKVLKNILMMLMNEYYIEYSLRLFYVLLNFLFYFWFVILFTRMFSSVTRSTCRLLQTFHANTVQYEYIICKRLCSISSRHSRDHFGIDYADCKAKFIANSKIICDNSSNNNQYEIPLLKLKPEDIHDDTNIDTSKDLSVDITIINENNTKTDHLLLHISGIHGAEGYTGSSIQNCFLHNLSQNTNQKIENLPVIILVHGLNPYGFQLGRRFNENNVDLNRNLKTDEQWKKYLNDDPDFAGYVTFDRLFNPNINVNIFLNKPIWIQYLYKKWFRHSYWIRAIYNAIRFGIPKLGAAATAGQCHKSDGVFYVGTKHELQHIKLQQFLTDRFDINTHWRTQFNKVTLIDIHTGVGPMGIDSLYSDNMIEFNKMKTLFPKHANDNNIELLSDNVNEINEGHKDSLQGAFEFATGFTPNYRDLFYKEISKDIDFVGIIQEFGTYDKMRVFQALREDNAVYQTYLKLLKNGRYKYDDPILNELKKYVNESHQFVKDVFYVDTDEWKISIVERGMDLLYSVVKR
eukprot:252813_1